MKQESQQNLCNHFAKIVYISMKFRQQKLWSTVSQSQWTFFSLLILLFSKVRKIQNSKFKSYEGSFTFEKYLKCNATKHKISLEFFLEHVGYSKVRFTHLLPFLAAHLLWLLVPQIQEVSPSSTLSSSGFPIQWPLQKDPP